MPHAFFKLQFWVHLSSGLAWKLPTTEAKIICNRYFCVIISIDSLLYAAQEECNSDVKSNGLGGISWKIWSAWEHLAQPKHKRLPPHAEKHLGNGCGGCPYYTAWEMCSRSLGHPYIMYTLLHPQLTLLNQWFEIHHQGLQHSAEDMTEVLTLTGSMHFYFTSPDWSGASNTEVLPLPQ